MRIEPGLKVGFTGSRDGMTDPQKVTVGELLAGAASLSHGDCQGADADAHHLAYSLNIWTIVHPPTKAYLRAYCDGDATYPSMPYLDRDRKIVDTTDILVATPNGMAEKFSGGTWYTIHYAEKKKSPIVIVWPDGSVTAKNYPENPPVRVYTDGACSGNPGPGGWAWAIEDGPSDSGGCHYTTNNRMELEAVMRAIESNPGPITVVMDSTYVKDGLEKWADGWIRRGWRTSDKRPVKNQDLWEPLVKLRDSRRGELTFEWVKGHSGDKMNDLVDGMATQQRDLFRPTEA